MKVLYSPKFPRVLRKPGGNNLHQIMSEQLNQMSDQFCQNTYCSLLETLSDSNLLCSSNVGTGREANSCDKRWPY